jgi:hypothetical protein
LILMLFEASLSTAYGDIIDDVCINRSWAVVRRGSGAVDPDTFRLADCYMPRARGLLNGLDAPPPAAADLPGHRLARDGDARQSSGSRLRMGLRARRARQ